MAPLTALIIEDDDELSIIFSHAFKAAKFDCEVLHSGETALERMEALRPALLLLDLHLPGMTGIDVLHAIQADGRFNSTRIIIASADPRMATLLEDEVDLILIKPVSFRQLREFGERFYAAMAESHNKPDPPVLLDNLPREQEPHAKAS